MVRKRLRDVQKARHNEYRECNTEAGIDRKGTRKVSDVTVSECN